MIRRWSRIDFTNNCLITKDKTRFRLLFVNFKRSIRFKKFFIKKTKFTRKSLFRLKSKGNWFLYLQILKSWTRDFKYYKALSKFQYNHKISLIHFLSYKTNFFQKISPIKSIGVNHFLSNFLIKKTFGHFYSFMKIKNFNNFYHFHTYILTQDRFIFFVKNETNALYLGFPLPGNNLLVMEKDNILDINKLDFQFNNILTALQQLNINNFVEFYKILTLLWIKILFKC